MPRFRKRPVVIEAEQWLGSLTARGLCTCPSDECGRAPHVHTAHAGQAVRLAHGDWIVPEPDGRGHYPVKPDIFDATYEPAEDAP